MSSSPPSVTTVTPSRASVVTSRLMGSDATRRPRTAHCAAAAAVASLLQAQDVGLAVVLVGAAHQPARHGRARNAVRDHVVDGRRVEAGPGELRADAARVHAVVQVAGGARGG